MTATAQIATVDQPIPRDRWGRPLVVPPDGGKAVGYTRPSTIGNTLDDSFGLTLWKMRNVAVGLADRPDLQLAVTAHRDDKSRLNDLCDQALEAAASSAKATIGTALHKLSELVDAGQELPTVSNEAQKALEVYRKITEPLTVIQTERFVVNDTHQYAGTPDRIVEWNGEKLIADLKTGKLSGSYCHSMAIQLACYANSEHFYDHVNEERSPFPDVNRRAAIIIHVPAEDPSAAALHWIDIGTAWREGFPLAVSVRGWRKRRGLLKKFK